MRILLVDDSGVVRMKVVEWLKNKHHSVTEAEDGAAALALLKKAPQEFDVVITDLNMPEKTGLELIDDMRADEKLRKIKRVLYSSDSSQWLLDEVRRKESLFADKKNNVRDIERALESLAAGAV